MLINYNPAWPLYILGTGISAQQIRNYISQESNVGQIICLEHTQFNTLTPDDQVIPGYLNFRDEFSKFVDTHPVKWVTYIHPEAFIDNTAEIGPGTVIMPATFINYKAKIGSHCIIAPFSMIGHGATLGNKSIISPNCCIGGSTTIGENFVAGQSVAISDHLTIVANVTCVIGSVVTKDIVKPGRYFSNRAMR